jgi:hypothetical protein
MSELDGHSKELFSLLRLLRAQLNGLIGTTSFFITPVSSPVSLMNLVV